MQVKKQQIGSRSGKEYVKAAYCHPAYLTYMQKTSCEMLQSMGSQRVRHDRVTELNSAYKLKKQDDNIQP